MVDLAALDRTISQAPTEGAAAVVSARWLKEVARELRRARKAGQ
jgi:hypothetical protein